MILQESFSLEKNQEKSIKFQLPFKEQMSEMDEIANSGFFKRGIISLAKKLKGVQSNYRIEVKAKVKGSTINAFVKKRTCLLVDFAPFVKNSNLIFFFIFLNLWLQYKNF